ncbi:hypothetical protein ACE38W_08425 [Chitinophaga sp. Hz27]|uniref:hypothetical protein n=1 Tax=Chitinophaga sp. Hz27 TaxID=3347169 RepID=UPI0035D72B82
MLNNRSMALLPRLKTGEDKITIMLSTMKQQSTKKLRLAKVKVANLSAPKSRGKVCLTSVDQTTCGCRTILTLDTCM